MGSIVVPEITYVPHKLPIMEIYVQKSPKTTRKKMLQIKKNDILSLYKELFVGGMMSFNCISKCPP